MFSWYQLSRHAIRLSRLVNRLFYTLDSSRLGSARLGSRGTFHARKVGKKRKGLFPFGRCRVTFAQRKRKLTVNRMLARFILNVRSLLTKLTKFRSTYRMFHTHSGLSPEISFLLLAAVHTMQHARLSIHEISRSMK